MLGNFIGGFIVIVIGVSILPAVADAVYGSLYVNNATVGYIRNTNISGSAATVASLLTLFYAIGLMSTGIALAVGGLKQAGVM